MPDVFLDVAEVGPGKFSAAIDSCIIVKFSRNPFFDACRRLLAGGWAPDVMLTMRNRGTPSVRAPIGEGAKWTVREEARGEMPPKFIRYVPFPRGAAQD